MPNWVYNSLTIQGPKDQIDSIKDKLNTSYTRHYEDYWDSDTRTTIAKDITFSNPVFSFWNIIAPTDLSAYVKQTDHTLSIEDRLKFETNDWYSWNVRNWGTKWDVAVHDDEEYPETELQEHKSEGEDQWLVYRFNTAWSPPMPAMINLSKLVANCVITLSYEEEQGWGGEAEFLSGVMISDSQYGWQCRECDHKEEETPWCEECEYDMCPSCGWGEPDEACQTHSVESETQLKENA
jgi:hypothetical protein